MKKRQLLFSAFLLSAAGAFAQSVPTHEMYVQYATPSGLVKALKNWEPGKNFGEATTTASSILYIRVVSMGSAGADFSTPSPFAQTLEDKNNNAKSKQMYCSRFIV